MRYNIKARWQPCHQLESFHWFIIYSVLMMVEVTDLAAAVVAGLLFDYQQSYKDTFLFAGSTMSFSGIVLVLACLHRRACRITRASALSSTPQTPVT